MGLGNVNIKLENGALGRVATTNDGVAGLIVTGKAVAEKLDLNKVYLFSGTQGSDYSRDYGGRKPVTLQGNYSILRTGRRRGGIVCTGG